MESSQTPPDELLEDIAYKFVYGAGVAALKNPVELMFFVEQAWWYYEDQVRAERPHLRRFNNYSTFTVMFASRVPRMSELLGDIQDTLKAYQAFKTRIPVYGAILMDKDMERVLLVRGKAASSGWGFPKGKINKGESEVECAVREVLEETGVDVEALIDANAFIEAKGQNDKLHKLFIVAGINPETTAFAPHLAGEIGAYGWYWLNELPATRADADSAYIASGGKQHRFYMVQPFISRLRNWVARRRRHVGLPPPTWATGQQQQQPQQPPQIQDVGAASTISIVAAAAVAATAATGALNVDAVSVAAAAAAAAAMAGGGVRQAGKPARQQQQQVQQQQQQQQLLQPQVQPPQQQQQQRPERAAAPTQAPPPTSSGHGPNLVLSSAFRFDVDAIMRALVATPA